MSRILIFTGKGGEKEELDLGQDGEDIVITL